METINKNDLIPCLKNSELANVFEDDHVIVEKKYVLTEIKIDNDEDFLRIMDILRYWMVNELPQKIYNYVIKSDVNLDSFKDFFYEKLMDHRQRIPLLEKIHNFHRQGYCTFLLDYRTKRMFEYSLDELKFALEQLEKQKQEDEKRYYLQEINKMIIEGTKKISDIYSLNDEHEYLQKKYKDIVLGEKVEYTKEEEYGEKMAEGCRLFENLSSFLGDKAPIKLNGFSRFVSKKGIGKTMCEIEKNYKNTPKMSPEIELLTSIIMSAFSFHFNNR